MKSNSHVMLDLETMGTTPGCAIVSIGAVQFDLDKATLGNKFYTSISLKSCVDVGLLTNPNTIMWWMDQSVEARAKLKTDVVNLSSGLQLFSNFMAQNQLTIVWGNSASFDCSILAACYDKLNLPTPWEHWNEKCYRTMVKLFPMNKLKKNALKAHDPIYDCEYQISILCALWKKINNKNFV